MHGATPPNGRFQITDVYLGTNFLQTELSESTKKKKIVFFL